MKRAFVYGSALAIAATIAVMVVATPAARAADSLSLSFSSYSASPAVVTHFSIEQELAPINPEIASGEADLGMPRMAGAKVLSVPRDQGRDGKWVISTQWVELPTDKAWTSTIEVSIKDLSVAYDSYTLLVIFGPNGELLIGSDKIGNQPGDRVDVVRNCGVRRPSADRVWRQETGYFPQIPIIMKTPQKSANPFCPWPTEG